MWPRPEVEVPGQSQQNAFMRWVIFMNLTVYPLGSFPAIFFFYVINYFLYSGDAPIYTSRFDYLCDDLFESLFDFFEYL